MELQVFYPEIIDFVRDNYHKTIRIEDKTSKSLAVLYTVKAFIFSKELTLDINIEAVENTFVTISYGGSTGVGALVTGTLAVLKVKMPEIASAMHHKNSNSLVVELEKIEKLRSIFKFLEIENLRFTADSIILSLKLK